MANEGNPAQPHGERLARLETELESIGRTLGRLDKTQERQAAALERVADGFRQLQTHADRIDRNTEDLLRIDRQAAAMREALQALETQRIQEVKDKHDELTVAFNELKSRMEARWWVIIAACSLGGFVGGLIFELAVRIFFQ